MSQVNGPEKRSKKFFSRATPLFNACLCCICIILLLAVSPQQRCTTPTNWIPNNLAAIQQGINSGAINPNNFTFAVFGDNRDDGTVFDRLLSQIGRDTDIAFGINLGDVVNHADECLYNNFFDKVAANFSLPLLTVIGNHELSPDTGYGRSLYQQIFGAKKFNPFYYSFQIGENYFIVVDDAGGKVDNPQMRWLKSELYKAQRYRNRFVFLHIPLDDCRPNGSHCLSHTEAAKLLALFQQSNVTTIFAGHIHDYLTGTWGEIPYVITGGAGVRLVSNSNYPNHHYVKVHVQNGQVTRSLQPLVQALQ